MDLSKYGQITKKDCWISSTIFGIFMATKKIPNLRIFKNVVILPNGKEIILKEIPKTYEEGVLRAVRTYFSTKTYQKHVKYQDLENYGSPDLVSNLLFNKNFNIFSTSWLSFYQYASLEKCKMMLANKSKSDVILLSFKANKSHLYVYISLFEENNNDKDIYCNLVDISYPEPKMVKYLLKDLSIFMILSL